MFTENNTDVKIRMQKYATNIRKSYEISNLSQKHEQCFMFNVSLNMNDVQKRGKCGR